jgi:hypothetical protein
MLQRLIYPTNLELDESRIACCPPPKKPNVPPPSQDPDCCYNTWQHELYFVNKELDEVNSSLAHVGRHLTVATDRLTRLATWDTELTYANDLGVKICRQLELIEAQLIVVCKNTESTRKGIEFLICMVREFYVTVDELQVKYDRLITCIKCLNNPALTVTQGIGKCLNDFGTALAAVVATRDGLILQVMAVYSAAVGLHEQICDGYGYKQLIVVWQKVLGCSIHCDDAFWGADPARQGAPPPNMPDAYWLDPILQLPICNDAYVHEINNLYKEEKKLVRDLTDEQTVLTKRKNHLTTVQTGLMNAIKEVQPSVRCS